MRFSSFASAAAVATVLASSGHLLAQPAQPAPTDLPPPPPPPPPAAHGQPPPPPGYYPPPPGYYPPPPGHYPPPGYPVGAYPPGYPAPVYVPQQPYVTYPAYPTAPPEPVEYEYRSEPRKGLVIAGAVLLGVGWIIPALIGATALADGNEELGPLLIPVAGPFITIGTAELFDDRDSLKPLAGA